MPGHGGLDFDIIIPCKKWQFADGSITFWDTTPARLGCTCVGAAKTPVGAQFCKHILHIIRGGWDDLIWESYPEAMRTPILVSMPHKSKGVVKFIEILIHRDEAGEGQRLVTIDQPVNKLFVEEIVVAYVPSVGRETRVPRRTIRTLLWPVLLELSQKAQCSRCGIPESIMALDLPKRTENLVQAAAIRDTLFVRDHAMCEFCFIASGNDLIPSV